MWVSIISIVVIILKYSATAVILILASIGAKSVASFFAFNRLIGHPANAAFKPSDLRIRRGRQVAEKNAEDVVVFLIGASIYKPWDLKAMSVLGTSMPDMLKELADNPESGFLGGYAYSGNPSVIVQYWRSFEQLIAYARNPSQVHFPAWSAVNRYYQKTKDKAGGPSFGLWHETYRVRAGDYEAIYVDLPPFGIGRIFGLTEAEGQKRTATGRMGLSDGTDEPKWEAASEAEQEKGKLTES